MVTEPAQVRVSPRRMVLLAVLLVLAAGLVVAGVALWSPAAAFVVAGVLLAVLAVAFLLEVDPAGREREQR